MIDDAAPLTREDLGGAGVATAAEIAQQPAVWRQVGADAGARADACRAFLAPLLADRRTRIVLTGAGTSAFAGRALAPSLSRVLGRRVEAVPTTDIVSNPREVFGDDVPTLLVSFARSGDSPESVAATELAGACLTAVAHLIITCNADGELARRYGGTGPTDRSSSLVLQMPAETNDTGFAMTSSFTSMVLACWLALTDPEHPQTIADRLAAAVQPLLDDPTPVTELARRDYRRVVYLGSGGLAGLAQEGALKLLELTAGTVVSFHDSSLGFRHGPKAVLDDATLAILFRSNDAYTAAYDDDIAAELTSGLGAANVFGVRAGDGTDPTAGVAFAGLDDLDDALLVGPFAVVAQLFALACSVRAGLTPDNPFPSGEVNRVVQGVTIHPLDRR